MTHQHLHQYIVVFLQTTTLHEWCCLQNLLMTNSIISSRILCWTK